MELNKKPLQKFWSDYVISIENIKKSLQKANAKYASIKSSIAQENSFSYTNSQINIVKKEISLKVEQNDINLAKNELEQIIETTVSNAKAEIKITTDSISQNLNKLITTVDSKANNNIVSTLSNNVSSLETNLSGIKGEVSSLETVTRTITNKVNQVQSDTNANKSNITTLTTEITTVKSNIATLDVNLKGITQRVSATEMSTNSLTNSMSNINSEITKTNSKVASIETNLSSITNKVSNVEQNLILNRKVGSFRYIRDYLNGSTSNANNHIVELQIWANNINIAQGKTATCSTGLSNGGAITDGNYSNSDDYASFGDGWQYIEIDLGTERTDIDMVKVWHYYYDGRAYNHKLMVSRDGSTWFELYNSEKNGKYKETKYGRTYLLNESYTETRLKTAEQKLTDSSIISTVSTQFYKKGETDSKYASQTQITQLSNQISSKVDANGVKSIITQNPDLIRTTFNNISTAITMYPEGMRVWHEGKGYTFLSHEEIYQTDNTAGRKLVSLKDGGFRVYKNDADNSYLGGIISGAKYLNGNTKGFGITLANGYKSWYTSIGHNPKVYNPSDESVTGYQHYLDVVFSQHYNQNGTFMRQGTHILYGGLDLHHLNMFDVGIIWLDKSAYDAVYKNQDGCMTIQCEDQIKFIRNSSRNQQREAFRCNFIDNEIQVNMDINGGGYTLYNTKWNASYSLMATSPRRSVGADTASVETMLLQEDFSKYDEDNNAVLVDMNEAIKSIYAKNKKLENENEDLKQENKNLKQELNITKNALDAVLMGGI